MPADDQVIDGTSTVAAFLEAAAAKRPAPGGGAVTALAGALAASIGEMVVNYSIGKKDLAAHESQFREALAELNRARRMMVELMVEDQAAFAALSAARKTAKGQGDRDPTFAAALLACIRVPQTISATAAAVLDLCGQLTPVANRFLLSDLAVCAELSMATVRCGAYNVMINLFEVSDERERGRLEQATAKVVLHSIARVREVLPGIRQRLEQESKQ
jgi:formiminotetrahydrofolate cyclodeaminase